MEIDYVSVGTVSMVPLQSAHEIDPNLVRVSRTFTNKIWELGRNISSRNSLFHSALHAFLTY